MTTFPRLAFWVSAEYVNSYISKGIGVDTYVALVSNS